jgi:hypothetical protein
MEDKGCDIGTSLCSGRGVGGDDTADEWVDQQVADAPHLFAPNLGGGSSSSAGGHGHSGNGRGVKNPV